MESAKRNSIQKSILAFALFWCFSALTAQVSILGGNTTMGVGEEKTFQLSNAGTSYYWTAHTTVNGTIGEIVGSRTQPTVKIEGVRTGSFTLQIQLNGGSGGIDAITVDVVCNSSPSNPVVQITQPTCTDNTGTIEVTSPISSTDPYEYSFDNGTTWGASNEKVVGTNSTYQVKVRDSNGCESNATTAIVDPQPTDINGIIFIYDTPATCSSPNGSFAIKNFRSEYTYTLNPGNVTLTDPTVVRPPGTYYITVSNGNCTNAANPASRTITGPSAPSPTITSSDLTKTDPLCGSTTGSIVMDNFGSGYEYSFNNGQTYSSSRTKSNIAGGSTVSVKVKTLDGCESNTLTVNMGPAKPTPDFDSNDLSLNNPDCGSTTGSIVIDNFGSGYEYSFNNGQSYSSTRTKSNIAGGTSLSLKIKSPQGCESDVLTVDMGPAKPTPSFDSNDLSVNDPVCGSTTGSITIDNFGSGYTYSFNNGQSYVATRTQSNIAGGTSVSLKIKSPQGCESSVLSVTMGAAQPTPTFDSGDISVSNPVCGATTGSITIDNFGSGYRYSFNNGQTFGTSRTRSNIPAGASRSIRIKSPQDCESSTVIVTIGSVQATPGLDLSDITINDPECGSTTGSIVFDNLGSGYEYSFNNGQSYGTNRTQSNIAAGTSLTLKIKNPESCESDTLTVTMGNAQATPNFTASSITRNDPDCGATTGSITIDNMGSGYEYSFDNGQTYGTGRTQSNIAGGSNLILKFKTPQGCESTGLNVTMGAARPRPATPVLTITAQPSCADPNGTISINDYGSGNTDHVYSISPSNGVSFANGVYTVPAGNTYTVSLAIANCSSLPSSSVVIGTVPSAPVQPEVTVTQPTCSVPSASFEITNYSNGQAYTLNPGNIAITSATHTVTSAGDYTLSVSANGCEGIPAELTILDTASPALPSITDIIQPSCATAKGSFTIANYDPLLSYAFSPSDEVLLDTQTGIVLAPAATYTVTASSGTNCTSDPSGAIELIAPANLCVDISINCSPLGATPVPLNAMGDNYIYSRTYQDRVTQIPNAKFAADATADKYIQDITYFDGLGRPIQQTAIRQSPSENDIITHIDYDAFGRMAKEWLPFQDNEVNNPIGRYRSDDMARATKEYYEEYYSEDFNVESNPFSEKRLERSALNRVLQQAAPGSDWALGSGHEIDFNYQANTVDDAVKRFDVSLSFGDGTYVPTIQARPNYLPGELYKNIIRDENHGPTDGKNHATEEFTDKQGRVVLKRTYADVVQPGGAVSAAEPHDTYYVYDDHGNLTYILPPKMNGDATHMNELGYQYVYDYRNRLVEKRIPGKGKEYVVYNKLDQPIMTQDANQQANNEWLFTKYDVFGRVAYTGKAVDGRGRTDLQGDAEAVTEPWVDQKAADQQGGFAGISDAIFYDNGAYPSSTISELLTINYYDTYVHRPNEVPGSVTLLDDPNSGVNSTDVRGLPTVNRVKVLDQSPSKWITMVTYYDEKGRPIYTHNINEFLETEDIVETSLDFIGKPLKTRTTHTRLLSGAEATIVTIDNFTYDHSGRLLAQTQCIGDETLGTACPGGTITDTTPELLLNGTVNDPQVHHSRIVASSATLVPGADLYIDPTSNGSGSQELIAYNTYDNLGLLKSKKVGGTASVANGTVGAVGLQTVSYDYNVRGWLTAINDVSSTAKLFNFKIGYNKPENGAAPLYNGNISETQWRTASTDNSLKAYTYGYDALNRITGAAGAGTMSKFDLSGIAYDKNGNLLSLTRMGPKSAMPVLNDTDDSDYGSMDVLDYAYHDNEMSNRLYKVRDDGEDDFGFKDGASDSQDYWYDANGNMTRDLNKGIGTTSTDGISYNYLNLPTEVVIDNGPDVGTISYIYDATGVKLRKNVLTNGVTTPTDYAGNYIYENNSLQFFSTPEGYVEPKNANNLTQGYNYIYQYKDHLGNVRLSYTDANNDGDIDVTNDPMTTELVEENNYYPFGLKHKGYNSVVNSTNAGQNFKYNGKEIDNDLGLNLYHYGFRLYDPVLGRFPSIDPIADKFPHVSTYNYAENDPVANIDLHGLQKWGMQIGHEKMKQHFRENGKPGELEEYEKAYNESTAAGGRFMAEFLGGFVPGAAQAIDLNDTHNAFNGGSTWDKVFALAAWVPGLDFLKSGNKFAKTIFKLGNEGIDFALDNVGRLQHSFKHAGDIKQFDGVNWNKQTGESWKNFNADILENATDTFDNVLGGTKVKGFYKNVDGQHIATYIYSEGKNQGKLATTVVLSEKQIEKFAINITE